MQQLTLVAHGSLAWEEVADPVLEGPGDALVRPVATTLCDLDRPIATGVFPLPLPIPFGHEFVAEVVAVGDDVSGVSVGDVVVVPFQLSDGSCPRCRRGRTANCEGVPSRSQYGFGEIGGAWGSGFADLVRVPFADAMLVAVPEGVDPVALAAAGDNLPDGYRCVAPHMADRPDAAVLVIGGIGSVPLYAAMYAAALGAARVDYVDTDEHRRVLAERVGATAWDDIPAAHHGRYDVVVDGSLLDPAGLGRAVRAMGKDAVCHGATMHLTDPTLPYLDLYMKGGELHTGRVHARALAPSAVALVASGAVDPTIVTDGEVREWSTADEAIFDAGVKPVFVRGR